ncbi:hypothetical protein [Nocardioides sp. 1609]|uniref:hypothetical protein n=1 Tax=Nocardioides sp. 1609 TaxID=2508327 RepID=UPI00106F9283|nr:hypothetical protein [Nocardioides sp. 1609]
MGELRIDPQQLRTRGTVNVPDQAERMARVAQDLFDGLGSLNSMSALAGDPTALRNLLQVGSDVYDELRKTVGSLNNIGVALVMTADDFHGTDEQAEKKYEHLTPAPLPPDYRDLETPGANSEDGGHVPSTPDAVDPDGYHPGR